jgi:hypothetical protein
MSLPVLPQKSLQGAPEIAESDTWSQMAGGAPWLAALDLLTLARCSEGHPLGTCSLRTTASRHKSGVRPPLWTVPCYSEHCYVCWWGSWEQPGVLGAGRASQCFLCHVTLTKISNVFDFPGQEVDWVGKEEPGSFQLIGPARLPPSSFPPCFCLQHLVSICCA